MPRYTLGQAAKATGKSKTQISRAVESGKISAERDGPTGPYSIDAAELHRVYPMVTDTGDGNTHTERSETPPVTPETPAETAGLEVELKALRDRLAAANMERERERTFFVDQVEDLRRRLDAESADRRKAEERAAGLTRLLAPPAPAPAAAPDRPKGWRRWFGS